MLLLVFVITIVFAFTIYVVLLILIIIVLKRADGTAAAWTRNAGQVEVSSKCDTAAGTSTSEQRGVGLRVKGLGFRIRGSRVECLCKSFNHPSLTLQLCRLMMNYIDINVVAVSNTSKNLCYGGGFEVLGSTKDQNLSRTGFKVPNKYWGPLYTPYINCI